MLGGVGVNSALAAGIAVDPSAAPHLSFNAGELAVLAIAVVLFLVVFVAGVSAARTRRQRERERQREFALDLAMNNISQGLCLFDADARIVLCNRPYINMYGLSRAVVKPGCTLLELLRHRRGVGLLTENPEQYARDILAGIAKGQTTTWLIETRSGRFIHALNHPIPGGGWVTTHEDVTNRRIAELALEGARAEAERAKSEAQLAHQRLRDAFDAVPEGLVLFDADDRLVMWNRRYAEMYPATNNITAGTQFEDVLWDGVAHGQYPAARGREKEFVAERLALHNLSRSSLEQQLPDDRWGAG
jgi:PAS domain-containing protein